MTKTPEMDADFARWYAEAFMDEGETREQRWKGVIQVSTTKADHETTEVLTRLAFQTPVPASGRKNEKLEDTYRVVIANIAGGDTAFDPSHSIRELQILAATALIRLVKTSSDAALNVTTASFGGSRRPALPMDLASIAENALKELSQRNHARQGAGELKLAAPKVNFTVSAEALQSMDPNQWKAQLDGLCTATNTAIDRVVTRQNRTVEAVLRQISLAEEELQMLWWLLGGHSRSSRTPFASMDAVAMPLILGHELAEMTEVAPGPASIRAMLSRAGVGTEQLSLADAVNAVERDWAEAATNSTLVSPVTTPIHFALEQRAEQGSTETWQTGWSALTGLDANVSLPSILLAELFYREHIFLFVNE